MIKFIFLKGLRFFYRIITKVIYLIIPFLSKIFILLRLNSRIINQLNKIRSESHKVDNHSDFISKLIQSNKLTALDVGAQGGFFDGSFFSKHHNKFFDPIVVEPIKEEAEKLIKQNYKVISKGLWSSNCIKKLYILDKRSGSSSVYKPQKTSYDLYGFKEKDRPLFNISREVNIECTTIKESLNRLNIKFLDFLKIDTQGAELEILKGLGEYLPLIIKVEAQVQPMYENIPNWGELISYFYKMDYMTCEWSEIGLHATRSPAEMDMVFVPNYLTSKGKEIILSREKEFISLMIIFGHIKLLQIVSKHLNFSENSKIQKLEDKFFQ